jgi:cell shape-determining protein MreC
MTMAMLLLFVLAMTPSRWTQWAGRFAEPVAFVVQPIAHPMMKFTRWMLPTPGERTGDDPQLRELIRQREESELALRQAQLRISQLERQVRDLQSGAPVAPGAHVRQLWAPVTARSSTLSDGVIRIGVGKADQVEPEASVATARGVYLVGRVVEVEARTSWVLPFNHPKAGHIEAVVMNGSTLAESFGCQLRGRGDGKLEGDLVAEAIGIQTGQLVRLRDESWPIAAQMLVLGRVVEVSSKENNRLVIVVEPDIAPDRVSEVVLRIPESQKTEATP